MAIVLCAGIAGLGAAGVFWIGGDRSGQTDLRDAAAAQPVRAALGQKTGAQEPEPLPPQPQPDPPAESDDTIQSLIDEQLEVVRQLMEDFPGSTDPIALMGNVLNRQGKTAEALKHWQLCLKRNPRRADAYDGMAAVAARKGDDRRAVELWRKAAAIDPRLDGLHFRMAESLLRLGHTAEAVAALKRDVALTPDAVESHFLLGQAYLRLKQHEKAKQSYLAAIQLKPDYTLAYYGLSRACAGLGQRDKSKQHAEKFRNLKAEDRRDLRGRKSEFDTLDSVRRIVAETHTAAGRVYRGHDFLRTAIKHWRRAAELDPGDTQCRRELAGLYEQLGRNSQALEICRRLVQLEPENARYHANLGVLYARVRRFDEALTSLRRALELEPEDAQYKKLYADVQKRN